MIGSYFNTVVTIVSVLALISAIFVPRKPYRFIKHWRGGKEPESYEVFLREGSLLVWRNTFLASDYDKQLALDRADKTYKHLMESRRLVQEELERARARRCTTEILGD